MKNIYDKIYFSIAKQEIKNNCHDNKIFFDFSKEQQEVFKSIINESKVVNSIIDFSDISKVKNLINNIPNDLNKDLIASIIYRQYIVISFFKNITNDKINHDILNQYNIITNTKFNKYKNNSNKMIDIMDINNYVDNLKAKNIKVRVHFFLDNVDDIILQKNINSFFTSKSYLKCNGYTEKEFLTSKFFTNDIPAFSINNIYKPARNYRRIENDEIKRLRKEF